MFQVAVVGSNFFWLNGCLQAILVWKKQRATVLTNTQLQRFVWEAINLVDITEFINQHKILWNLYSRLTKPNFGAFSTGTTMLLKWSNAKHKTNTSGGSQASAIEICCCGDRHKYGNTYYICLRVQYIYIYTYIYIFIYIYIYVIHTYINLYVYDRPVYLCVFVSRYCLKKWILFLQLIYQRVRWKSMQCINMWDIENIAMENRWK